MVTLIASVIIIVLALLAFSISLLATLPGRYRVVERRTLKAPIEQVYQTLIDFRTWPKWSPWLLQEPDAQLEFSKEMGIENAYYTWQGQAIGTGKITHQKLLENSEIQQSLQFIRPFKSQSQITWRLTASDEGTELEWQMDSKMPFWMRWMTQKMQAMLSKDFQIGLLRLDQLLSDFADTFTLDFKGVSQRQTQTCLKQRISGHLDEIGEPIRAAFNQLFDQLETKGLSPSAPPLTSVIETNLKNRTTTCDICIPLSESDTHSFSNEELTEIPAGQYFLASYQGPYDHLELVWHATMSHLFMHKLKYDKSRPSLEVYLNDPKNTEANQLVTELYIPVR